MEINKYKPHSNLSMAVAKFTGATLTPSMQASAASPSTHHPRAPSKFEQQDIPLLVRRLRRLHYY
jgi:hypothetical protein